jgi:hypothetical protein
VFIRKGVPIPEEPVAKPEKPKPVAKPKDDKKPSSKPASKPSGATKPERASRSESTEDVESDPEVSDGDVESDEESDIDAEQDNGWGPLGTRLARNFPWHVNLIVCVSLLTLVFCFDKDPLVLRKNSRVLWDSRDDWAGNTKDKELHALAKLIAGGTKESLKSFEELLNLCTEGEDGWRVVVATMSAHSQISEPRRLLLLDFAVTAPAPNLKTQLILQCIYKKMLLARAAENVELAQKLRLGSALLVYRLIELIGVPRFVNERMWSWPECGMFPIDQLASSFPSFAFLRKTKYGGHPGGALVRLWELVREDDAGYIDESPTYTDCIEVPYVANELLKLASKSMGIYEAIASTDAVFFRILDDKSNWLLAQAGQLDIVTPVVTLLARSGSKIVRKLVERPYFSEYMRDQFKGPDVHLRCLDAIKYTSAKEMQAAISLMRPICTTWTAEDIEAAQKWATDNKNAQFKGLEWSGKPWGGWAFCSDAHSLVEELKVKKISKYVNFSTDFGKFVQECDDEFKDPKIQDGLSPIGTPILYCLFFALRLTFFFSCRFENLEVPPQTFLDSSQQLGKEDNKRGLYQVSGNDLHDGS